MMTTRKSAQAANQNKYYTGKPCRKGHLSFRYTQSGTCAACINEGSHSSRQDDLRNFIEQSVEVFVFCPPKNLEMLKEAVRQLNAARWLASDVIMARTSEGDSYIWKYRTRTHPDDAKTVRDIGEAFCKPYKQNAKAIYAAIYGRLNPPLPPIEPRR